MRGRVYTLLLPSPRAATKSGFHWSPDGSLLLPLVLLSVGGFRIRIDKVNVLSQCFRIVETRSINPTTLFIRVTKPSKPFALTLSLTRELSLGTFRRPKAITV
jgi:hypothetical protein